MNMAKTSDREAFPKAVELVDRTSRLAGRKHRAANDIEDGDRTLGLGKTWSTGCPRHLRHRSRVRKLQHQSFQEISP